MGREPLGRGMGVGSKAGKELPDLAIHPPLGLTHLGDREREDRGKGQKDREDTMRLCLPPGRARPSQPPTPVLSVHKCQCLTLWPLYLLPFASREMGGAPWNGPSLRGEAHRVGAPGKRGADSSAQAQARGAGGSPKGICGAETAPWASRSVHAHGTSPSHSQFCNVSQGQHWSGPGIRLGPGLAWGKTTQEGQGLSSKLLLGLCSLVSSLGP